MTRLVLALASAAALACGSVADRQGCSVSTDCPAGETCAHVQGASVCWPDAVPPTVSSVTVSCATTPCLRDGVLHVEAAATDDNEVLGADVSVDLYPGRWFPMTKAGASWVADVPLAVLPFEAFERDVVASVYARDGARNVSAAGAGNAVVVTRLKWQRAVDTVVGLSVTPPAVMSDGSVVVGGSNGKVYFVAPDGTDLHAALVVGAGQITAAPAIGQHAIWVGSEDGNLYAVQLDGSAVIANVGVNVGGPIKGSVAVNGTASKDTAIVTCKQADSTGWIGVASSVIYQSHFASAPDGFTSGPVIAQDGLVHSPSATLANDATLRSFTISDTPFGLLPTWTTSVGKGSPAPLSVDSTGAVIEASEEATPRLKRTVPGASPTTSTLGDLAALTLDTSLVLADGDVVAGDESGAIHRFTASGPAWTPAPNLGSPVRGPMVLTDPYVSIVVPTNAGKVFALADDGHTVWSGALPSATQLRAGNLYTPAAAPGAPITSLAYFSSGNGRLYAVIVDGALDAAAPWPKAFHDPRNTNHAGPQP